MQIIKFEPEYRDDLIFMILEAKNALGRVPGLNEDLLNNQKNYFDRGDMFWIAVDDNNRVIGNVGYSSVENSSDVVLHRLFVKHYFGNGRTGIYSSVGFIFVTCVMNIRTISSIHKAYEYSKFLYMLDFTKS